MNCLCLLSKKCRKSKSKEIINNMAKEQNILEEIFATIFTKDLKTSK